MHTQYFLHDNLQYVRNARICIDIFDHILFFHLNITLITLPLTNDLSYSLYIAFDNVLNFTRKLCRLDMDLLPKKHIRTTAIYIYTKYAILLTP